MRLLLASVASSLLMAAAPPISTRQSMDPSQYSPTPPTTPSFILRKNTPCLTGETEMTSPLMAQSDVFHKCVPAS